MSNLLKKKIIFILWFDYYAKYITGSPKNAKKVDASRLTGNEIFSVHWLVNIRGNKKEEKCHLWLREKENFMYKLYVNRLSVGIVQN